MVASDELSLGDVIVIWYPHREDRQKGEPRWAIITEDLGDEFVIVPMSKQIHQQCLYPNSFIIERYSNDGVDMDLLYDSLIIPDRAQRFKKKFLKVIEKKGKCNDETLDRILGIL